MLHDYFVSLIRTGVPVGVGAALAWLASRAGVVLDTDSSTALTAAVVALTVAVYYALARALESRWSWAGLLLGRRSTPTYGFTEPNSSDVRGLRTGRPDRSWPRTPQ